MYQVTAGVIGQVDSVLYWIFLDDTKNNMIYRTINWKRGTECDYKRDDCDLNLQLEERPHIFKMIIISPLWETIRGVKFPHER